MLTFAELRQLRDMLRFKRPHGSKTEKRFIARFLLPLAPRVDAFGNLSIAIPLANGSPSRVLWSSHVDTVHSEGGKQSITLRNGKIRLGEKSKSNCLGADCTIGVFIMLQMIKARIPGLYVFHRAEEIGGLGSEYIFQNEEKLFRGINFAIAFDRRGRDSIITHQLGMRTASDSFARSLAKQLGKNYRADSTGVFTDSANYADAIPECSNVSVGFFNEHSKEESIDIAHVAALLARLRNFDESKLVCERDPFVHSQEYSFDRAARRDEESFPRDNFSLLRMIKDNPEQVREILADYGLDDDSIMQEIYFRGGALR